MRPPPHRWCHFRVDTLTSTLPDTLPDILPSTLPQHPPSLATTPSPVGCRQSNGFEGDALALWDVPFWSERQSEKLFGFEEEELRPYFSLPNVLNGLFGLCKRLYGVDIVKADGEAEVWHPDVGFFKVRLALTRLDSTRLDSTRLDLTSSRCGWGAAGVPQRVGSL